MIARLGLGFSLIFWAVYTVLTVVLVYIIAVKNKHVYPFLPTISHAGSATPERNIFSELIIIGTFWSFINLFARFLQLQLTLNLHNAASCLKRVNCLSLIFGVLGALGLITIATWPVPSYPQENPTMYWMHSIGSGLLYISCAVYMWLQTGITFALWRSNINDTLIFCTRLSLVTLYTTSGLIHGIFDRIATRKREEFDKVRHSYGKWEPGYVGYSDRTISDVAEWITVLSLVAYTLTFFKEFQSVEIDINCYQKGNRTGDSSTNIGNQYTILDTNENQ